jgi:hypothetical protein
MTVDVEVCLVAVHPVAHPVRQPTDSKNVSGAIQDKGVGLIQALAAQNLVFNREETRVFGLKGMYGRHAVQ